MDIALELLWSVRQGLTRRDEVLGSTEKQDGYSTHVTSMYDIKRRPVLHRHMKSH